MLNSTLMAGGHREPAVRTSFGSEVSFFKSTPKGTSKSHARVGEPMKIKKVTHMTVRNAQPLVYERMGKFWSPVGIEVVGESVSMKVRARKVHKDYYREYSIVDTLKTNPSISFDELVEKSNQLNVANGGRDRKGQSEAICKAVLYTLTRFGFAKVEGKMVKLSIS